MVLQNYWLDHDKINELVVGIPTGTGNKDSKLIFEFPIGFTHNYKEDLEDVTLRFSFGKESPLPVPNDGIRIAPDSIEATKVTREYIDNTDGRYVVLKYPKIGAHYTFMIKELMSIGSSIIEIVIPFTTKDDISGKQGVRSIFALTFTIDVEIKGEVVSSVKFKLYGLEAKDRDDLIGVYMKEIRKNKVKEDFSEESDVSFFYYPKYKLVHKDKYINFYVGEHVAEAMIPLSWNPKDE